MSEAEYDRKTLVAIAVELGLPSNDHNANIIVEVQALKDALAKPIEMLLWCPSCHARHIDEGDFAKTVHRDHACQSCGLVWRPSKRPTVGVRFLSGYKNGEPKA